MTTQIALSQELAILGGEPLCATPLVHPDFPPVDEATGRKMMELYMSGKWAFNGEIEKNFCRDFAAYHGAKHGVFMFNGTVTLQCALGVFGVGPGDEVIVPGLTWLGTANAVRYLGATPVFADVEPSTLCLDPEAFEAAITPKTKAVIPVHLYGSTANLDAILEIARHHDLKVIEDCAHAHGGKWNGRGLGSWGDVGSFSFQQSKTMSSGEGGICITNDDETAERLFRMKHIGYASHASQGEAKAGPPPGLLCHNFRATEFQALVLQDQLGGLEERMAHYNRSAAQLAAQLDGVPGLRVLQPGRLADPQSYYCLGISFDEEPLAHVPLDTIIQAVVAEGGDLNRTYGPVYEHTLFNLSPQEFRIAPAGCPVTDAQSERVGVIMHHFLGVDSDTISRMGDILCKVAENSEALTSFTSSSSGSGDDNE